MTRGGRRRSPPHTGHYGREFAWRSEPQSACATVGRRDAASLELVSTNVLRFRTQAELTQSLTDIGFSVEHVFVRIEGRFDE